MRYRGGGIGHQDTLEYTYMFEVDAGIDFDALPRYDEYGDVVEHEMGDIEEEAEEEDDMLFEPTGDSDEDKSDLDQDLGDSEQDGSDSESEWDEDSDSE